jgi:hypothetical protein
VFHKVLHCTAKPTSLHCSTQIVPAGVAFYLLSDKESHELLVCGFIANMNEQPRALLKVMMVYSQEVPFKRGQMNV